MEYRVDIAVKRRMALCCVALMLLCAASSALPSAISGLWQGPDRYVLFDGQSDEAAVVLRLYDKWYDDRTAEPLSYKETAPRTRNSATVAEAEHITAEAAEIVPNAAWQISARYGKRAEDTAVIPVAVIDNEMYLNFAVRTGNLPFYQGVKGQDAIRSCPMPSDGEIYSYYAADEAVYRLRYWPVQLMASEKSERMASFTGGGNVYEVPAQITSLGRVYSCVTGRSSKVRDVNVVRLPPSYLSGKRNSSGTVIALGAPSMTKLLSVSEAQGSLSNGGEDAKRLLLSIAAEANRRRCPPPKPLLPPSSVDWHLDLINSLEQGNLVIAAVRERSRQFAASGALAGREDAAGAMAENSRLVPDW